MASPAKIIVGNFAQHMWILKKLKKCKFNECSAIFEIYIIHIHCYYTYSIMHLAEASITGF